MTTVPDRCGLVLCGPAGSGKSSVLRRLVEAAQPSSLGTGEPTGIGAAMRALAPDLDEITFGTRQRTFGAVDVPGGGEDTLWSVIAGCASADAALLVVDVREATVPAAVAQARVSHLFGAERIALVVNKMDLVDFSESAYRQVVDAYAAALRDLPIALEAIPVSALLGDNVIRRSDRCPWFDGPSLIDWIEGVPPARARTSAPLRFRVDTAGRSSGAFVCAGTCVSGRVDAGDPIVAATTGAASQVRAVAVADTQARPFAAAGDRATFTLADDLDLEPGELLVPPNSRPDVSDQFAGHVVWAGAEPMLPGRSYLLHAGAPAVPVRVTALKHVFDAETGQHVAARTLRRGGIALCNLDTAKPLAFEPYEENRAIGAALLTDRFTGAPVGAVFLRFGLRRATNIHRQPLLVDMATRARLNGHRPVILWFTGLSGAGKSTIANLVERELHGRGAHTYLLDGDNVRHGLSRDLGFTAADRVENIRRVGEVAKLFVDAGLVVLCSFISPFRAERRLVRDLVEDGQFLEIYVETSLEECIRRDPKGLYARARSGALQNFTGIDSPYEVPEHPDLTLHTTELGPEACAGIVVTELRRRGIVP